MTALRIGELFAGYGGLGMGTQAVLGGDIAWVSEIDPGACKILAHRFPDIPNHGDITAIDWASVEPVDVLTGGFPCQDLSLAGLRKGLKPDTRSGLWTQFAYAISQLRPSLVVIENVRGLLSADAHSDLEPCPWCVGDAGGSPLRALGAVLGDLADLGYDASWQGLRAADVGAPHGRFRVFVIAWPAADAERGGRDGRTGTSGAGRRVEPADGGFALADAYGAGLEGARTGRPRAERPQPVGTAGSAADSGGLGGERRRGSGELAGPSGAREGDRSERQWHGDAADDCGATAADANGAGLGRLEELHTAPQAGEGARNRHDADGLAVAARGVDWGSYGDAIRRWERCLMRPAPLPTERGKNRQPRLSPAFVEWMMGLPAGWVTDVPSLSRNDQLKALGNGVVPQQAAQALRLLLPDVEAVAA